MKLSHFGRSRLCLSEFTEASCLDSSDILWYQPPERLLGEDQITVATDIWSCGSVDSVDFSILTLLLPKVEKLMHIRVTSRGLVAGLVCSFVHMLHILDFMIWMNPFTVLLISS